MIRLINRNLISLLITANQYDRINIWRYFHQATSENYENAPYVFRDK